MNSNEENPKDSDDRSNVDVDAVEQAIARESEWLALQKGIVGSCVGELNKKPCAVFFLISNVADVERLKKDITAKLAPIPVDFKVMNQGFKLHLGDENSN